jgi:very-short-patch-repair endonuclease
MGELLNRKPQKAIRQYLRNTSTDAERKLWSELKGSQLMGWKFRRQQGVGTYVVHFYCPEYKLAIEVDGVTHYTEEELAHDNERQKWIEQYGIIFLRVTNEDVLDNIDGVLMMILEKIEAIKATTSPPAAVSPPH